MDRRRVFRDLTQSLSSGFFSDKVVIILARIKNTKQIEPSDIEILSGVEEFFDNVLAGYRWSEKPSFSENSLKYASSFNKKPLFLAGFGLSWIVLDYFGGDEGDRTPDLGVANAALSQLSYIPKISSSHKEKVGKHI